MISNYNQKLHTKILHVMDLGIINFPHLCLDGQAIFGVGFWYD